MKTIIIDDEPLAISRLKRLLSKYEDFEVIEEAKNGQDGLGKIEIYQPDVIFLDIEMPILTGFEMLSRLSFMPLVVFATAYDQYAIKAFEENSIDYLLKPIEADRLDKTIEKLRKLKSNNNSSTTNESLLKLIEQFKPKKEIHSISVKSGERILFIPLHEISFFEASDKYVFLNTTEGKQYLTSYTITTLEEKLPTDFVRVSRSSIINSHLIKELERYFNGKYLVIMRDSKSSKIETGTSFNDNLKRLMEI
jgi:two-component system, LytTR family, response regulator